jgi:hypothetical protein
LYVDRLITLPQPEGPRLFGLAHDKYGFIPVDSHGRVSGVDEVHAAGDVTAFPLKQGGLAAQQADAIAEVIAGEPGVPLTPKPFSPVLRGLLMTGERRSICVPSPSACHGRRPSRSRRCRCAGARVMRPLRRPSLCGGLR